MGKETAPPPDLPAGLATDAFRRAWADFLQHRKEIGATLRPIGTKRALDKLAVWGEAKAIVAIEQSIANGWSGLFEPRGVISKKTSAQLDKEQRADKQRASELLREKQRREEEIKKRIERVATIPLERLEAARKYFANLASNEVTKAALLKADPLGGGMLTDLIYAALVAREAK